MTDDELKALVASIAVAQKVTDEQMKRTDEQMKRTGEKIASLRESQKATDEQMKHTDEQMKRTDDRMKLTDEKFASLRESQKATDEQIKRTGEQMKLTYGQMKLTDEKFASLNESKKAIDEQIERTEAQLEKTSRKIDRLAELYGNVSQNQGDVAEEFFLNSLLKDNHLGAIHFDDVARNMEKHRGQIQEEYDLVMTNGDAVGIVEVKYKAHINDLDKLDRKMRHFKKLFPIYQKYKQYGAIASFHINDDAKKEALKRGYFVLQRSGDLVHTESSDHLTVL